MNHKHQSSISKSSANPSSSAPRTTVGRVSPSQSQNLLVVTNTEVKEKSSMPPLPDQNARSVLSCLPFVSLARHEGTEKKQSTTHMTEVDRKKKATTPLFQNRATRGRGRQLVLITSPLSSLPSCCSLLSPPQHHNRSPSAHHPPRKPENRLAQDRQTQHTQHPKSSKP